MKTKSRKFFYSAIVFCLFISNQILAVKNIEFSKSFEWSFNVDKNVTIELRNYDCDVNIVTTNENMVVFNIHIDADGKEQEDIDILVDYLESLNFSSSSDLVRLESTFWSSRNSNGIVGKNVTKMKLKNGKTIKLSEFNIRASLEVPKSAQLELTSKYSKIDIDDIEKLVLDSYDDKIYGNNVSSNTEIKAKYSKINFTDFGPTNIDIYDCKITVENTDELKIKSKYSDIIIDYAKYAEIDGYDDNMKFKTTDDLKVKTKYSDFTGLKSGNLILSIYDSDFNINEIGNLTIRESKYSGYTFANVGDINVTTSYDDAFNIENLILCKVVSSKYSDYIFTNLEASFEIFEGYDDKIKILNTSSAFKYFSMNNKYGNVSMKIPAALPLKIDWKTKYGNIDFDDSSFNTKIKIKENSEFEYQGARGNVSADMPYIKVRGYDIKLKLID